MFIDSVRTGEKPARAGVVQVYAFHVLKVIKGRAG